MPEKSTEKKINPTKELKKSVRKIIHSLDAQSLSDIYFHFSAKYPNPQFYPVHDCFGTTCDKVDFLKETLVFSYIRLYSYDTYLETFNQGIKDHMARSTASHWVGNKLVTESGEYEMLDIDWLLKNKHISEKKIKNILSQHVII